MKIKKGRPSKLADLDPGELTRMQEHWLAGTPDSRFAEMFNVSTRTIRRWMQREVGKRPNPKRKTDE
jgi:uncharacterized protein YjcR